MKHILLISLICIQALSVWADEKINFNYKDAELTKIIEDYSKANGANFIVDSTVRGRVTILNPEAVSQECAYNDLSTALAVNGFAIVHQKDANVVRNARSVQRDLIEVSSEVPTIDPVRMYTWVYTPHYVAAMDVMKDIRILTSSYGEMTSSSTNQIIITDWTTNINRVSEVLKQVDKPVSAATKKLMADARKERESRHEVFEKRVRMHDGKKEVESSEIKKSTE